MKSVTRKHTGFTLVETIITLVLVSISGRDSLCFFLSRRHRQQHADTPDAGSQQSAYGYGKYHFGIRPTRSDKLGGFEVESRYSLPE